MYSSINLAHKTRKPDPNVYFFSSLISKADYMWWISNVSTCAADSDNSDPKLIVAWYKLVHACLVWIHTLVNLVEKEKGGSHIHMTFRSDSVSAFLDWNLVLLLATASRPWGRIARRRTDLLQRHDAHDGNHTFGIARRGWTCFIQETRTHQIEFNIQLHVKLCCSWESHEYIGMLTVMCGLSGSISSKE